MFWEIIWKERPQEGQTEGALFGRLFLEMLRYPTHSNIVFAPLALVFFPIPPPCCFFLVGLCVSPCVVLDW